MRSLIISAFYTVEERSDGWWFKPLAFPWVGPYPSFAAMSEQLGNHLEKMMVHQYRQYYGRTPK